MQRKFYIVKTKRFDKEAKNYKYAINGVCLGENFMKLISYTLCLYLRNHKVLLRLKRIFVRVRKILSVISHRKSLYMYEILLSINFLYKTYSYRVVYNTLNELTEYILYNKHIEVNIKSLVKFVYLNKIVKVKFFLIIV